MTTIVVPAAFLGVTSSPPVIPVPTSASPTPAGQPTRIEIRAVDTNGTTYASYPTGQLVSYVETLDSWEEVEFLIPLDVDADLAAGQPGTPKLPLANVDQTPERYVQIWRNGFLLFWGIPVTVRADSHQRAWRYTARGHLWILSRRNIGKASRTDLLRGRGNFEGSDLGFWAQVGTGLTVTSETGIKLLDDKAARLVTTNDTIDRYISYTFAQEAGAIGLALFLTGWVYIVDATEPRADKVGLWLGISPDEFFAADNLYRFATAPIDSGTPVNGWRRLTCAASVLPNATEYVQIRLYGLNEGDVIWDAVTVTALESLSMIGANSPGGNGWDQISIAHEIVKDLQGVSVSFSTTLGVHNGKSNLGIGTAGAASGVIKERTYQHADHPRGYNGGQGQAALDDFSKASDGFDYRVDVTPTTKTFRTYYPTVGTTWDFELVWVTETAPDGRTLVVESYGIVSWSYDASILNAANQIVELGGWGSGAGREEGGYSNPGSLGGLTLEYIEGAPNGTPIDLLDAVAEARGAQLEQPLLTPSFVIAEPRDGTGAVIRTLIGVLRAGDFLPFRVSDGSLQMDGTYRLSRVTYDPKTETLALVPNPLPIGGGS